jgi:hypothetical protein
MKRFTCGFRVEKMRLDFPSNPEWDAATPIPDILSQPFRYLDRGAQCYVFESLNSPCVIKIFRFDQLQNPIRRFFRSQIKRKAPKRSLEERVSRLFDACKLAETKAPQETGLIYLHLNATQGELPILQATAPLGQKIHLPLDHYRFVVQKKAQSLSEALLAAKREDRMKERLDALHSLLKKRIALGIGNSDPSLWRNFGFIGTQAIELDFGNYYSAPHLNEEKEIERYKSRLSQWLEVNAPEWVSYLRELQ